MIYAFLADVCPSDARRQAKLEIMEILYFQHGTNNHLRNIRSIISLYVKMFGYLCLNFKHLATLKIVSQSCVSLCSVVVPDDDGDDVVEAAVLAAVGAGGAAQATNMAAPTIAKSGTDWRDDGNCRCLGNCILTDTFNLLHLQRSIITFPWFSGFEGMGMNFN